MGSPGLEISLDAAFVLSFDTNTSFGVFTETFFEEVGFAVKGDRRHPWDRVGDLIHARLLEGN